MPSRPTTRSTARGRLILLVEERHRGSLALRAPAAAAGDSRSRRRPMGPEALQILEQQRFDLVLTGAVMPGVVRPELIRRSKDSARPPSDPHVGLHVGDAARIRGGRHSAVAQAVHELPSSCGAAPRARGTTRRGGHPHDQTARAALSTTTRRCASSRPGRWSRSPGAAQCTTSPRRPRPRRDTTTSCSLDVSLPGPSGMTLLDELRRLAADRGAHAVGRNGPLAVAREALELRRWDTSSSRSSTGSPDSSHRCAIFAASLGGFGAGGDARPDRAGWRD